MTEYSCQLEADFQSIETLRTLLDRIEMDSSIDKKHFSEIKLALIEIFTNIVKHGELLSEDLIDVQMRSTNKEMEIKFIDQGIQFLPTILETVMPKISSNVDLLPEKGFGVPLVVSVADSVKYERVEDRNFTTLVFVLGE